MKVKILLPIGYCFGVKNAFNGLNEILKKEKNRNIFLLGKIVNNKFAIDEQNFKNVSIIDVLPLEYEKNIENLSNNDVVIFSAHGHDKSLEKILDNKNIVHYELTCPIIKSNISLANNFLANNGEIIYVGIKNHPETICFTSLSEKIHFFESNFSIENNKRIGILYQTTLNSSLVNKAKDEIIKKYPNAQDLNSICNATSQRQEILKNLSDEFDLIVVIGDKTSSNSNRLFEIAKQYHPQKCVLFVEDLKELQKYYHSFKNCKKGAVCSGTSTPSKIIDEIYKYLLSF